MTVPYVHSGYKRVAGDDYHTIDFRCTDALMTSWPEISTSVPIVDCCAPSGSGIVDRLNGAWAAHAWGSPDAFVPFACAWIITNPPYKRPLVDQIASHLVNRVKAGTLLGAALLMRANWDTASSRSAIFDIPEYAGQTRMRFRPWWSPDRKSAPIHNYCWLVWMADRPSAEPVVRYFPNAHSRLFAVGAPLLAEAS